jgi:hypothetical protein
MTQISASDAVSVFRESKVGKDFLGSVGESTGLAAVANFFGNHSLDKAPVDFGEGFTWNETTVTSSIKIDVFAVKSFEASKAFDTGQVTRSQTGSVMLRINGAF